MKEENGFFNARSAWWLFGAFLIGFIVLKIPHLSLPFFWDESGVYGKMIYQLADTGLSLHPKAIDQWISRGHPLLYPNIIAGFCNLFGTNVTVAHIANFTFACLLLISMYRCLSKAFQPWIGFIACALLMAQPIFYTQSVFVLPEIALAFFLWWTTWFFIQKKYLLYFLAGTGAVLVKEPAIIWIGSLMLWEVLKNRKLISWKMLLWLTPLIPFFIFIYVQKSTFGWYFFPFYTGSIDLKIGSLTGNLKDLLEFLFWKHGRIIWLAMIIFVLFGVLLHKLKKNTGEIIFLPDSRYQSGLFAGAVYVLFSSTIFFCDRYLIPVLSIVTTMVGFIGFHYVFRKQYVFILFFVVCMSVISFLYISSDKFNYDNDMSYIRSIDSTKKTIRYMLERNMLVQDQFSATMPVIFALSDSRFGYLPADTMARHSSALHEGSNYAVQVIPGTQIENPDQRPLLLLDEWYDRNIITRIYQVLPMDSSQIKK